MKKLLAAAAILVVASAAHANLLYNGSFEEDNFGVPGYFPGWEQKVFYWPGWGTAAPVLNRIPSYGIFTGTGLPFDGDYFAGTDYGGHANFHIGLFQSFNTQPGIEYKVTGGFMGGLQNSNDTVWWEVKVSPGTTNDPDAPGVVIAKKDRGPGGGEIQFREAFENTFVAGDTTSTIFLKWGRVQSAEYKLEAAGFDALNVEVVPEPGSLLALASGIAGFAGLVVRRKA